MKQQRYEQIINKILAWAGEHDREFMECLIRAAGFTPEEIEYFEINEWLDGFYDLQNPKPNNAEED